MSSTWAPDMVTWYWSHCRSHWHTLRRARKTADWLENNDVKNEDSNAVMQLWSYKIVHWVSCCWWNVSELQPQSWILLTPGIYNFPRHVTLTVKCHRSVRGFCCCSSQIFLQKPFQEICIKASSTQCVCNIVPISCGTAQKSTLL